MDLFFNFAMLKWFKPSTKPQTTERDSTISPRPQHLDELDSTRSSVTKNEDSRSSWFSKRPASPKKTLSKNIISAGLDAQTTRINRVRLNIFYPDTIGNLQIVVPADCLVPTILETLHDAYANQFCTQDTLILYVVDSYGFAKEVSPYIFADALLPHMLIVRRMENANVGSKFYLRHLIDNIMSQTIFNYDARKQYDEAGNELDTRSSQSAIKKGAHPASATDNAVLRDSPDGSSSMPEADRKVTDKIRNLSQAPNSLQILLKQKLACLTDVYLGYRRIRGDGNCYYRAIGFGLLEQIVSLESIEERVFHYRRLINIFCNVDSSRRGSDEKSFESLIQYLIEASGAYVVN